MVEITEVTESDEDRLPLSIYHSNDGRCVVAVGYFRRKKPFLGGYRDVGTGLEYHHAATQTFCSPWKYRNVEKSHRDTQTVVTKNKLQQTSRDAWTQMEVPRLYLHFEEKIIFPSGCYISADVIEHRRLQAILLLQRNWKCWLARQELRKRKIKALMHIMWDQHHAKLREKEEGNWVNQLEYQRAYPSSKDDFIHLLSELQKWQNNEIKHLKSSQSGAQLKSSLWMLLDEEVKKLQDIQLKKQHMQEVEKLENHDAFLAKAATPKVWKAYKDTVNVETAGTQKARYLHDLYITLSKLKFTRKDRISALLQLKEVVKPYPCTLTKELASLADREIHLMGIKGMKDSDLLGLRTRIRDLMWQFAKQPAFNPETLRLSALRTKDGKRPHILLCSSCNQHYILPPDALDEATTCSVSHKRFIKCKNCKYLQNEGWIRKDFEIYKRMLKLLKAEEKKKNTSGIVYTLRPSDISYMVEKIWKSQSCLSNLSDLKTLEFVRWNVEKEWTPWNCLLVTRKEALVHNKLENYKQIYSKKLQHTVYLKHIQARNYFSQIPRYLPYISLPYSDSDYDIPSKEGYISSDE